MREEAAVRILDFRAATTAEKNAMFHYADGKVSAIIGSYARALTADARVSESGTATITDAGRTGSLMSVGGMDGETRIQEYLTGIPAWAKDAVAAPELQGCMIDFDESGRATAIEVMRIPCGEEFNEGAGHSNQN